MAPYLISRSAVSHVLISPDKFKGSLTAKEAAQSLARGMQGRTGRSSIRCLPVADGGEGTVDAAVAAGFSLVQVTVDGPTGLPVRSAFAARDQTAVVEMASASGLRLLPRGVADPLGATSIGTGQLVLAALDHRCRTIVLGVGGSACTDGGSGMLAALGATLLDRRGEPVPRGGGGLRLLDRVDLSGLDRRLSEVRFVLASDVDNTLLGRNGAASVYAPQKGAAALEVQMLEAGLRRWAELVDPEAAALPGAGAAGGVGFAAIAVLGADRRPGADVVLDLVGFAGHLAGATLVVTGEGSLDHQTLRGKAPAGVASAARPVGIPVVAACGRCELSPEELSEAGFAKAYPLAEVTSGRSESMKRAGSLLSQVGRRIASDWFG